VVNTETRPRVRALIYSFMEKWIADRIPAAELERIAREGVSLTGLLTPFHDALVPGITLLGERSFSTRLGNLHEKVAALVAAEVHAEVQQPHDLSGAIPVLSREFITQRISALERREAQPDAHYEREQIYGHFGNKVNAATRIDLYIRTLGGEDHYFEIKSAKPNKGQCSEMKSRLLTALAIRRQDSTHARWGVPYNPYGRGEYRWVYPLAFFDFEHEVMLGEPFWNFIGGAGTYQELLEVYRQVGKAFAERLWKLRERLIV
jgi:Type II restriction endonuclease, TdeIII